MCYKHYRFVILSQGSQAIFSLYHLLGAGIKLKDILCLSFAQQDSNKPYIEFLKYIGVDYRLRLKNERFEDDLSSISYDYILSISWNCILSRRELSYAKKGNINFHPGRLPDYQGCFSTCWSIINQEKYVGYTWHIMDEQVDTGNILYQQDIKIGDKNAQQLYFQIFTQGLAVIPKVIQAFENNQSVENMKLQGTYYKNVLPYEGIIDPNWDDGTVNRFIKAMYFPPFKGAVLKTDQGEFECHTIEQYIQYKQQYIQDKIK